MKAFHSGFTLSSSDKTPFEEYFSDPNFIDIPIEGLPPRTLVKKILKQGTGQKMTEIINTKPRKDKSTPKAPNSSLNNKKVFDLSHLKLGLKISFHYAGYFEYDSAPFDSTQARGEQWSEILGVGKMIPALENCLLDMKSNEKAVVMARSSICFGSYGCGQRIPKEADIMFKIWLDSYNEMSLMDQFSQLTQAQRVQGIKSGAFSLKRVMNVVSQENDRIRKEYFTKNRFAEAQQEYSKIVGFVKKIPLLDEETENYVKSVTHKFLNNMGICALKRCRYKGAQDLMEKAIETSSGDKKLMCKSYFISGKSHRLRNYFQTAKQFYEKALKLEPYHQDIQMEFLLLEQDKSQKNKEEKMMWSNAFEKSFEKCRNNDSDSEVSTLVGSVNSKPSKSSKSQNVDKNNNVIVNFPKAFLIHLNLLHFGKI